MERMWPARLRWRLRGAWLAPLLVVLTIGDALILHWRPLAGDHTDLFGALILAGVFNLFVCAIVAPIAAMLIRRVRPDLPTVVARDYAGVGLIVLVTAAVATIGIVHHGTVVKQRRILADAMERGQAYIGDHAPAEFRRHVVVSDIVPIVDGKVYRVCAPGEHPQRSYCVVVRTDVAFPAGIRYDGGESNALFAAGMR